MGEVTMAANVSLLPKINSLFNNPLYSDIQFYFMNGDGTFERIYCHKLILALQSETFAHQFYEKETSLSVVKMQSSKKQLFYRLFKFLYTGDLQFHTFDEAQDLYELANDYLVEELIKKCHNYMFQSRLTIENLFFRYEVALQRQLDVVLKDCRKFICSNIQTIFTSDEFANASREVIEDIIKQDDIPLSTEFELIRAVLKWGSQSLRRHGEADSGRNLREAIDPFLKHLRILSLTIPEFQDLVKNYDIFSAFESTILLQKIIMPESISNFPENFCSITSKRGTKIFNIQASAEYQQRDSIKPNQNLLSKSVLANSSRTMTSNSSRTMTSNSSRTMTSNSSRTMTLNSSRTMTSNSSRPVTSNSAQSMTSNSAKSVQSDSPSSVRSNSPNSVPSDPPKIRQSDIRIAYEVRKYPANSSNVSSRFNQKFNSYPNILDIEFPAPSFSQNLLREFLFPLKDSKKSFKLSFRDDVKSSVVIKLNSGNLSLYGFELKVRNKNVEKEVLEVSVYLQGFSKQFFEKSYNIELQNDVYMIKFPKSMKLQEGNKGRLEVCIEDLALDRCSQIAKKKYELNCGLNFECEFYIESNKRTDDDDQDFLFLINKLIYVPC